MFYYCSFELLHGGFGVAKKRRRSEEAPLPATSAGLIRFFEDESVGVKVSPFLVVAVAASIIAAVMLALYLSSSGSWLTQFAGQSPYAGLSF